MSLTTNQRNILNVFLTQLLWFICVMGGDTWALCAGFAYLMLYYTVIGNVEQEWRGILTIAGIGLAFDALLSFIGVVRFESAYCFPVWLIVLWLSFATLFYHGLHWLKSYRLIAVIFGAIAGPLSYWAGATLSGSRIEIPLTVYLGLYSMAWAAYMPLFLSLAYNTGVSSTLSQNYRANEHA